MTPAQKRFVRNVILAIVAAVIAALQAQMTGVGNDVASPALVAIFGIIVSMADNYLHANYPPQ